jgi:hypothetical protein
MDRVTQRLWRGVEGPRWCFIYPLLLGAFQPPGRYGFSSGPVGAYIDIHGSHTSTLYIGISSNLYQPHR